MSYKSHTEDCGYTVTGHAHNCSCPAGDDEAQAESLEQARLLGMGGEREAALRGTVTRLEAEIARLREALQYIAKQPTDQTASPEQCSMVAVATEALAAVRGEKEGQ
jgi:hypothetical protein